MSLSAFTKAVVGQVLEHEAVAILTNLTPRFVVHEAGEVRPDGSQHCRRCGWQILAPAPPGMNRALWGYPMARRVVQGPVCTYVVSADRQLASDEVPCT